MRRLSWWVVGASFACSLSISSAAVAQRAAAPTPGTPSYEGLIREALSEFDARNYAEARALFERAHALKPNARTLRGLGITAFELKRYVQALDELGAALADARNPLTDAQHRDVQELIAKAQRFVGKVKLQVTPDGAAVFVDGVASETTEFALDLGEHRISVLAEGYRDAELKLTIDGGEDSTHRVDLLPVEVSPERVAASEPQRDAAAFTHADHAQGAARDADEGGSIFGEWWFWTATGLVVAGAVVGTVLLVSGDTTTKVEPVTTANTPPGARLQAAVVW